MTPGVRGLCQNIVQRENALTIISSTEEYMNCIDKTKKILDNVSILTT